MPIPLPKKFRSQWIEHSRRPMDEYRNLLKNRPDLLMNQRDRYYKDALRERDARIRQWVEQFPEDDIYPDVVSPNTFDRRIEDFRRKKQIQREFLDQDIPPRTRTMEYRPWRDYDPNAGLDDGVYRPGDYNPLIDYEEVR